MKKTSLLIAMAAGCIASGVAAAEALSSVVASGSCGAGQLIHIKNLTSFEIFVGYEIRVVGSEDLVGSATMTLGPEQTLPVGYCTAGKLGKLNAYIISQAKLQSSP